MRAIHDDPEDDLNTEEYSAPNSAPQIEMIRLEDIGNSPLNPRKRIDPDALRDLANDLRLRGVIQPITVRYANKAADFAHPALADRRYVIVTGERRWRAAGIADLSAIPAIIVQDMTDAEHLATAYAENAHRSDLSPIECAATYDRMLLLEPTLTQAALGERLKVSQPLINNRLRLWRNLPLAIRDKVDLGVIPESHAMELCRLSEYPSALQLVAEQLEEEGLNLKQTRLRVAALLSQLEDEARAKAAQVALPLGLEPAAEETKQEEPAPAPEPEPAIVAPPASEPAEDIEETIPPLEEPETTPEPGPEPTPETESEQEEAEDAAPPATSPDAITQPVAPVAPPVATTPAPAPKVVTAEPEAVDAPKGGARIATTILQSDDDRLWDLNWTLDVALAMLWRHQEYLLPTPARKLIKALRDSDEGGASLSPSEWLTAHLRKTAEERGIDIETVLENPE